MLNIKLFHVNSFFERTAIVWNENGNGFIVDPGFIDGERKARVLNCIKENGIHPLAVLLTHAHFDHIYGVKECIDLYGTPVYMHPDDKPVLEEAEIFAKSFDMPIPDTSWKTIDIYNGQILDFDGIKVKVITTPGHSPGSVSYFCEEEKQLFSGDTLFEGTIGNTSMRYGEYDKEILSIMEKLMLLDSDVQVHPGHGGSTTIGEERMNNPFLQPFNEKDPETGAVDGISFK